MRRNYNDKFLNNVDLRKPLSDHPIWQDVRGVWLPVPQLSGGSTLYDLSPYGDHIPQTDPNKMPSWCATDRGLALDFNGTSDLLTKTISHGTGSLTYAVWCRPSADSIQGYVMGVQSSGSDGGRMLRIKDTNIAQFEIIGSAIRDANSPSAMSANELVFLCGVKDDEKTTGYIYVDGQESGSVSLSGVSFSVERTNFTIGRRPDGADYWNNLIGDCFTWPRALSPDEVATLYDQSLRGYPDLINRVPTLRHFFMAPAGVATGIATFPSTFSDGTLEGIFRQSI